MRRKTMMVTPEIAKSFLEKVTPERQRRFRPTLADFYAAQMRAGLWDLTHQGIAFDVDGNLIDGQHRMAAIVSTGVTLEMDVSWDLPAISLRSIDGGMKRAIGDELGRIYKIASSCQVAAICSWISSFCCRNHVKTNVAMSQRVYQMFQPSIDSVLKELTGCGILRRQTISGPIVFARQSDPVPIDKFLHSLASMDFAPGQPAHSLKRFLDNQPRGALSQAYVSNAVLYAAQMAVIGDECRVVRGSTSGAVFFRERLRKTVNKVRTLYGANYINASELEE